MGSTFETGAAFAALPFYWQRDGAERYPSICIALTSKLLPTRQCLIKFSQFLSSGSDDEDGGVKWQIVSRCLRLQI